MDIGVFTEYVREHQAGLRAFIRSLGADPDWVDDIAQEAFVVAWQRIEVFQKDGDFGKWLRGIARNILRNEARKQTRRKRIVSARLTEELTQVAESTDEKAPWFSPEFIQALRDCLAELPERARLILAHRYEEDMKSRALARRFGVRHDAMRQFLVRVRVQLRSCIEKKIGEALA